jgi:hypothetical protein
MTRKTDHLIMYLPAHETGNPPGLPNLFSEEDNQVLNNQWYAETIQAGDQASGHLVQTWCRYQQGCSQKVHDQ